MKVMRFVLSRLGRLVFWLGLAWIVLHAVAWSWFRGNYVWAILELAFFPVTFFVYPWYVKGMWVVFGAAMVGYWLSIYVGQMPALGWRGPENGGS